MRTLRSNIKQCKAETGKDERNLGCLWKLSFALAFKHFVHSLSPLREIEEKNSHTLIIKPLLMLKYCYG